MLLILHLILKGYQEFSDKHKDVRIDHYPLMGSPLKIFALLAVFLLFVKKVGPAYMKDRQPFNVKNGMLIYNILQIIGNCMLVVVGTHLLMTNSSYQDWGCMRLIRGENLTDVICSYFYYILKVIDLMDTIFMVLRKNYKQITFLHVYHHVLMVAITYAVTRFLGGGHMFMVGYINCFVHAIMYSYYFISVFRPDIKNSLWWKKHITHIQLLQFFFLIIHFSRALLRPDCDEPRILLAFAFIQNVFMISLFLNFYYKAYVKPKKLKLINAE